MDIKKIRKKHKLTQAEMASRLSVSISTVRKWEYGIRNPSSSTKKLIRILFKDENDS